MQKHFRRIHYHHTPAWSIQNSTEIIYNSPFTSTKFHGRILLCLISAGKQELATLYKHFVIRKQFLPYRNHLVKTRRPELGIRICGMMYFIPYQIQHLIVKQKRHHTVKLKIGTTVQPVSMHSRRPLRINRRRNIIKIIPVHKRSQSTQPIGIVTEAFGQRLGKACFTRTIGSYNHNLLNRIRNQLTGAVLSGRQQYTHNL